MHSAPETIGGYKVVRELGRGAMGTVYLAYQESLGRDLAIKLMAPEFTRDSEFVERFRREGRIAARLRHPHIVQVYDFSDRDGQYFIAMEYLGSRDLKALVREKGRIELAEAVKFADQLLAALEHAHAQGVVHRDIKPANVMVTDNGDAALTDFSIAHMKSSSKLTQTGSVLGTPEYMAPEQFEGRADARSDLYATGIILYEMLTGFSPFHADTIAEIMKKQLMVAPDPPAVVDFTIPEPISEVVVKSLVKEPADRYQSAAEMRQALRHAHQVQMSRSREVPRPVQLTEASAPVSTPTPTPPPVPAVAATPPPVALKPVAPPVAGQKVCAECGTAVQSQRFCPNCGHDTTRPSTAKPTPPPVTPKAEPVGAAASPWAAPAQQAAPAPAHVPTPEVARPPQPARLDLRPKGPAVEKAVNAFQRPEPQAAPSVPSWAKADRPSEKPANTSFFAKFTDFLDAQGLNIILLTSGLSTALLLAPKAMANEVTVVLAGTGMLGLMAMICMSFVHMVFLWRREAGTGRTIAPVMIAIGLFVILIVGIMMIGPEVSSV